MLLTTQAQANQKIAQAFATVEDLLQAFIQNHGFELNHLSMAFGNEVDQGVLADLVTQLTTGDFSGLPTIGLRSGDDLAGAKGVYVAELDQILLSEAFVATASQERLVAVILEELGHSFDARLNITDSAGDEGDIFARLVLGEDLSETQLAALYAENDSLTLEIDGQTVFAEASAANADDTQYGTNSNETFYGLTRFTFITVPFPPFLIPIPNTNWKDYIEMGGGADSGNGLDGNDTIYGGSGNDTIHGDNGHDSLFGDGDHDYILAGWGNDTVDGGSGNDEIHGDTGADSLSGGSGNDTIYGTSSSGSAETANDTIDGGSGNDKLYGDKGNDSIRGGAHNDVIDGARGNDKLYGDSGNDTIYGEDGGDYIEGNGDADLLYGYNSSNFATGSYDGDDTIKGGSGNDTIWGSAGDDDLFGDANDDLIYGDVNEQRSATSSYGDDSIEGGSGNDTLYGEDGNDILKGGSDADLLYGGSGSDYLEGGTGNDSLYGDTTYVSGSQVEGNDELWGNDGNDLLKGDGGADTLHGGDHADTLYGGSGNDKLYGNDGDDILFAVSGNDTLEGGEGNDILFSSDLGIGVSGSLRGDAGFDTFVLGDASGEADLASVGSWSWANLDYDGWDLAKIAVDVSLSLTPLKSVKAVAAEALNLAEALSSPAEVIDKETTDSAKVIVQDFDIREDVLFIPINSTLLTLEDPANNVTFSTDIRWEMMSEGQGINIFRDDTSAGEDRVAEIFFFDDPTLGDAEQPHPSKTQISQSAFYLTSSGALDTDGNAIPDTYSNSNLGSDTNYLVIGATGPQFLYGDYTNSDNEVQINHNFHGTETFNDILYGYEPISQFTDPSIFTSRLKADGRDELYGYGGDDLLAGGGGNDLLNGGAGDDTATYADALVGVEVDLVNGTAQDGIYPSSDSTQTGTDQLVSIEHVIGSDYGDSITGDGYGNILVGGAGNDTLVGGDGNDTYGINADLSGSDLIMGESANIALYTHHDTYISGHVNGSVVQQVSVGIQETFDVVDNGDGTIALETYHGKYIRGHSNGSVVQQTFVGTQERFEVVDNGNGTIALETNLGKYLKAHSNGSVVQQTYVGSWERFQLFSNTSDILDFSSTENSGITIDLGSTSAQQVTNTYSVTLQDSGLGFGDIENVIGTAQADAIVGNLYNNQLVGGAGSDTLTGGGSADIFVFQAEDASVDIITDFSASEGDQIQVDSAAFAAFYTTGSGGFTSQADGNDMDSCTMAILLPP
jgi:Ca2+-binding RTX toxin-like protein